jgi:hypothetical protein
VPKCTLIHCGAHQSLHSLLWEGHAIPGAYACTKYCCPLPCMSTCVHSCKLLRQASGPHRFPSSTTRSSNTTITTPTTSSSSAGRRLQRLLSSSKRASRALLGPAVQPGWQECHIGARCDECCSVWGADDITSIHPVLHEGEFEAAAAAACLIIIIIIPCKPYLSSHTSNKLLLPLV